MAPNAASYAAVVLSHAAAAEEDALWARSGAMALSGRPDGPRLLPPGAPATHVHEALDAFSQATLARTGVHPPLPGVELLGERAASAGLSANAPWSCGGTFRAMPTRDGFLGLSLGRPEDVELVPALVGNATIDQPWHSVATWASSTTTEEAAERADLMGLPHAAWPPRATTRPGVIQTIGAARSVPDAPVVVDLTALWAGPLCAHLLGLAGCRIVKVESRTRPDGTRRGPQRFLDLLHGGHESVALDFEDPRDRERLSGLLSRADLVLESSRPRALRNMGIRAEDYVSDGVTWLSITARGRASSTVGFGDDVAVSAGLAVEEGGELLPLGDAIADPLSGVTAARVAGEALLGDRSSLIDVSMLDVARETIVERPATDQAAVAVAPPTARVPALKAPVLGQHNEVWLP